MKEKPMSSASESKATRVESVRLTDGRRVFRVVDAVTDLCLERVASLLAGGRS